MRPQARPGKKRQNPRSLCSSQRTPAQDTRRAAARPRAHHDEARRKIRQEQRHQPRRRHRRSRRRPGARRSQTGTSRGRTHSPARMTTFQQAPHSEGGATQQPGRRVASLSSLAHTARHRSLHKPRRAGARSARQLLWHEQAGDLVYLAQRLCPAGNSPSIRSIPSGTPSSPQRHGQGSVVLRSRNTLQGRQQQSACAGLWSSAPRDATLSRVVHATFFATAALDE
mmetsp:Transcript_12927/g.45828  ORF Transcript_12927/g.45828 Transcript_12927/m.45828 type:complete len:226 (+) Transcript_12927:1401-2078(+)